MIRLGSRRDMVTRNLVWEGVTLIPDEITKAGQGRSNCHHRCHAARRENLAGGRFLQAAIASRRVGDGPAMEHRAVYEGSN